MKSKSWTNQPIIIDKGRIQLPVNHNEISVNTFLFVVKDGVGLYNGFSGVSTMG